MLSAEQKLQKSMIHKSTSNIQENGNFVCAHPKLLLCVSMSCPSSFNPENMPPLVTLNRSCVMPEIQSGHFGKRKFRCPCRESNQNSLVTWPQAYSLYCPCSYNTLFFLNKPHTINNVHVSPNRYAEHSTMSPHLSLSLAHTRTHTQR
jgi:hypothetical protein